MSASETAPFPAPRVPVRDGGSALRGRLIDRVADAWPLAVIAVGGVLSLAWIGALAWSALELVIWLV